MSNCRLVQIEVRDFKSFGGSHLIGPFEDFTGIVGPNGSGKSNVLDSLAFVFYLDRNPRSTSYIHSVIGAPRVDDCSVRVTLEEEGGKKKKKKATHTYERVYDYKGNSILYIDEKEVDEDEYLKIIGEKGFIPLIFVKQTEVDLIARKTPIELTQLFEEISGSKEYAKRYDELRIESEASHEAVSMIEKRRRAAISEKRHISDRKDEAKKFRDLLEKEEETQVKSSLLQLYYMNEQKQQMQETIETLYKKKGELEPKSIEAKQKLKSIEDDLRETSNHLVLIDREYKEAEQKKRDANSKKIQYTETQTMLEVQIKDAQNKLDQTSDHEVRLRKDLERYINDKEKIERQLNELKPVEELESQIAYYNTIREQASKQFDDITQDLRRAMKERSEALRKKADLDDQKETLTQSRKKKNEFIDQCTKKKEKEEIRYNEINKSVQTKEGEKKLKETQNKFDSEKQSKMIQRLHELEKQCDEIRRIEGSDKRKERFNKQLAKMSQIIPGVYGLFSDLVEPINKKYDAAALAGCGGYKDAIVVKDSQTAIRCLEFLKEGGHGDARLLPLLNLKPVKVSTKKSVNLLSRLMKHEDIIKPAVEFVCGHIAVADDIKKAKSLAFGENITVVTLDGTIIDPRGIMTGGTTRNKPRFAKENLGKLEEDKAKLEKDLGQLGNDISKRKSELEAIEDELLTLRPQLNYQETKIKEYETRIDNANREIRIIDRQLKTLEKDINEATKECDQKEAEVKSINLTQSKNDQRIFEKFCEEVNVKDIKDFEINRLQDYQERYAKRLELTSRLSQLETYISDIENQNEEETTDNYRSQLEKFRSQLDEANRNINESTIEYTKMSKKLDEIKKQKESILADDQSNRSEAKEQRKLCQKISEQLDKNSDEINDAEHELSAAKAAIKSVLQQARLANIKLPKIDGNENDNDEEEFTHTPSSFTQEKIDETEANDIDYMNYLTAAERSMSQKDAKKQVENYEKTLADVRRKISQIRPDLKSDDRYTKVEEELKEIEKGQEELRTKAAKTKKEFNEVKTKRKDKFMQLYETVDQHIDKIYKELTRVKNHESRSGTAYLSLEDTEEPYLGGIKYTAMPPHKRFRDLEQLSGGEKAVASLALVIALQKYTVAPFILMDEPDASLDKLNLRAAADALSKISKSTQIVSVSLRDRFFEHSDALVGIYKDKNSQSSGILTLNLNQMVNSNNNNLEMDDLDE